MRLCQKFHKKKNQNSHFSSILFQIKDTDDYCSDYWPIGICLDCKFNLTKATIFFNGCSNAQNLLLEQFGTPEENLYESGTNTFPTPDNDEDTENEMVDPDVIEMADSEEEPLSVLKNKNNNSEMGFKFDDSFSSETSLTCNECKITFAFERSLKYHIQSHHKRKAKKKIVLESDSDFAGEKSKKNPKSKSKTTETPSGYKCMLCHKILKSRKTLRAHKSTHEERLHACEICKKVFKSYRGLFQHKKAHSTKIKYKCNKCGEGFTLKRVYNLHIQECINY